MANNKKSKETEKPTEEAKASEEKEAVEVEKPVEAEKPVKAKKAKAKPDEIKKFKNNSEKGIKIKLVGEDKSFKWITVKPGDIVTISKKIAKANGLVKVE